jgi:hypothetical protein
MNEIKVGSIVVANDDSGIHGKIIKIAPSAGGDKYPPIATISLSKPIERYGIILFQTWVRITNLSLAR